MKVHEGVTKSGIHYAIDNRYMAVSGSEEERRTIEEQRQAAHEILVRYALRHTKEQAV